MRRLITAKRLAVPGVLVALFCVATGSFGYWATGGNGNASAAVADLSAPTGVTASSTLRSGTVSVSWTGVTAPNGGSVDGYYIVRYSGSTPRAACGTSSSSLTTAVSCGDPSVSDGTYTYKVVAVWRSWTAMSSGSSSVTVVNDATPPTVSSIDRTDSSPTNASTVHWTLTVSESVTGVGTSDFALAGSGTFGASITGVSGSGTTYTVTASTGADGTLGLDLVDDDSITDVAGNKLGGTGAGNGSFAGQTYVVDRTAPTVSSISRAGAGQYVSAGPLSFAVSFSEPVSNVTAARFSLVTSGLGGTAPSISSVTASGGAPSATWTVSVSTTGATGTDSGSIGLNLTSLGTIQDVATNGLSALPPVVGQAYTFDTTAPTVSSIVRAGTSPTNTGPLTWTVTFSEPVSGATASSFGLVTSVLGGTAPTISSVTASDGSPSATWTVSVSTAGTAGANAGSIGLNLTSASGLADRATNSLSASLPVVGQAYTFDTTAPTVSSIVRAGTSPTNTGPLTWTVTFSEPVSSVASSSFGLVLSGVSGTTPAISSVTASGGPPSATWTVTASTTGAVGTNSGSIGLNLTGVGAIRDVAANALSASPPVVGQAYAYDTAVPTAADIQATNGTGTAGRIGTGDVITYTFSEQMSAASILSGWTGSATAVTVSFANSGSNDSFSVSGTNLGTVATGANYVGASSAVAATMVMSGTKVTVTLNASPSSPNTVASSTLTWAPSSSARDVAGNAMSTTAKTESGAPKQNF